MDLKSFSLFPKEEDKKIISYNKICTYNKIISKQEECKNNDIIQLYPIIEIDNNNKNNNKQITQEKFFNSKETKLINSTKEKKILGRKRKTDKSESINNKYSDSCLRSKCKHILLYNLKKFINKKIYEMYGGKIGYGAYVKNLLNLDYKQNKNVNVEYNKNFLNKKICDIFSESISNSYTNYKKDHNKSLIKELMEEEDITKKNYFNKLFNLTFLECLKHFRKDEFIPELKGFDEYDNEIKKYDNDLDYKECLDYQLKHFEEIINKKKSRNREKNS